MDLVLDEEVDQGHEGAEEPPRQVFPVLDGLGVGRAEGDASDGPRDGEDEVRDHEDVVPVMVVGRGDVCPAAARQGADEARDGDGLGEGAAGPRGEQVPQSDEGESRPWRRGVSCQQQQQQQQRSAWQRVGRIRGRSARVPDVMAMKSMKMERSG